MSEINTDVLVVGAGPAGSSAAAYAARAGRQYRGEEAEIPRASPVAGNPVAAAERCEIAQRARRVPLLRRAAYRTLMFVAGLALVVVIWETYKALGPADGGKLFGARVLPRTSDYAMPHVWDMFSRFNRPEVRGSDRTVFSRRFHMT